MRVGISCIFAALFFLMNVRPAEGQSLIQQYREALFEARADEILRRHGMRAEPRPPDHMPSDADTLAAWWGRHDVAPPPPPPPPPPFTNARWRHIRRLERSWFERTFADVRWAYAGNAQRTRLDTTMTPELRARLESRFGAPTITLVEMAEETMEWTDEHIQFEYWLVLNDSIPVRIMDVAGPLDRGLIIVSSAEERSRLQDLRSALQRELFESAQEEPYVDYYFDELSGLWYESGYDGARYFTRNISRPVLLRGRPLIPRDE